MSESKDPYANTTISPTSAANLNVGLLEATSMTERFNEISTLKKVDLRKEEDRYALRHEIEAELKPWFVARTLEQVSQALDEVGACWGPYQTVRQALESDPDLSTKNPMFEEINQPGIGKHIAAGSPIDFSSIPRIPVEAAPILGSDTASVLTEKLGLSETDIDDLRNRGVV